MIKTFEQFNDLDPYGEEDWNENQIVYYIILYTENLIVVKGKLTKDNVWGDCYAFHGDTINDYDCVFGQEYLDEVRIGFSDIFTKDEEKYIHIVSKELFPEAFSDAIDMISPPDAENYDADFVFGMKDQMESEIEEKGYLKLI